MNLFKRIVSLLPALALVLALSVPSTLVHAASPAAGFSCSKTYDPASLTTLTQTSTTVTCPGAALGDFTIVASSIDQALVTISAYVSAANTVTILVVNGSAGTINLASSTFTVRVIPNYISP